MPIISKEMYNKLSGVYTRALMLSKEQLIKPEKIQTMDMETSKKMRKLTDAFYKAYEDYIELAKDETSEHSEKSKSISIMEKKLAKLIQVYYKYSQYGEYREHLLKIRYLLNAKI